MNNTKTITATGNQKERTFTIRVSYSDGQKAKYRTGRMSKEEFEDHEYFTSGDWQDYLRTSADYHRVDR